jgi:hypothetical protein
VDGTDLDVVGTNFFLGRDLFDADYGFQSKLGLCSHNQQRKVKICGWVNGHSV